jgi:hypothetical protein
LAALPSSAVVPLWPQAVSAKAEIKAIAKERIPTSSEDCFEPSTGV